MSDKLYTTFLDKYRVNPFKDQTTTSSITNNNGTIDYTPIQNRLYQSAAINNPDLSGPTYYGDQSGYNSPTGIYAANLAGLNEGTDNYISQILEQAGGDKDFAIKILTRDHELAVGSDDAQTAAFLEKVSDDLEAKIGRIPYDYEITSKRIGEDLSRKTEVTNRDTNLALSRISEDEKIWKDQFARESGDVRQSESESLSERGLLQGKRGEAEGLAGREVGRTEGSLSRTLSAYDRALGRDVSDIETSREDTLFGAERLASRGEDDAKTIARRGVVDAGDTFTFGTEDAQRRYEARQKELERQRALDKLANKSRAVTLGGLA